LTRRRWKTVPRTAVALLAAVIAAGLIVAGCGDDDEETTTAATTTETGATGATGAAGGEPLSKQEFIRQADEICREGDRQIDQEAEESFGGQEPEAAELEEFATEVVVPNIQQQLDGIRSLTPPEGDEDEISAIVDAAQDGVDELEADPGKLTQGQDAGGAFTEANRLAQEYGLKECGDG
jgi:hypothetical protein